MGTRPIPNDELSEADRLELARRIVDSVVADQQSAVEVAKAVQGTSTSLTARTATTTGLPRSELGKRQAAPHRVVKVIVVDFIGASK